MAIIATTIAAALPAAASTIVVNGSFETGVPGNVAGANGRIFGAMPGYGGWDLWQALNGWTRPSGAPAIEVQTDGTLGLGAQDGDYYLEMDSTRNATIEQIVSLRRGNYTLSFWYSPRKMDATTNTVDYALGTLLEGSVVGPSIRQGTAVGAWTRIASEFRVTSAGAYTLRFSGAGKQDSLGGLIDNVSIDIASVPVPATGILMLGGLAGLAALKRRRRA